MLYFVFDCAIAPHVLTSQDEKESHLVSKQFLEPR